MVHSDGMVGDNSNSRSQKSCYVPAEYLFSAVLFSVAFESFRVIQRVGFSFKEDPVFFVTDTV